jgi:hypothetical protein
MICATPRPTRPTTSRRRLRRRRHDRLGPECCSPQGPGQPARRRCGRVRDRTAARCCLPCLGQGAGSGAGDQGLGSAAHRPGQGRRQGGRRQPRRTGQGRRRHGPQRRPGCQEPAVSNDHLVGLTHPCTGSWSSQVMPGRLEGTRSGTGTTVVRRPRRVAVHHVPNGTHVDATTDRDSSDARGLVRSRATEMFPLS